MSCYNFPMALSYSSLILLLLVIGITESGYIITTPRRWTIGSDSQICASLTQGTFSPTDSLKYTLTEAYQRGVLQEETGLAFPEGEAFACTNVPVPSTVDRHVTLAVTGNVASEPVSEMVNLTFVQPTGKTFIQTDKYLYKPGQKVQFRILSIKNPNLTVATDSYEEVYVENPTRTRIAQWKNVDNTGGLVHLEFDLHDEVEEGTYTIRAKFPDEHSEQKIFRVEEYVLPRYEVTIEAPKNILGSDETVTVKLCAKYTFGEPVKGNATIYLAAASWKVYANLTENRQISGCDNFTFPTKDLLFDYNNCHIRISNLKASAVVVEEGTGVELYGSNDFIQVHRRAIQFRDKSPSTVRKPYLPHSVEIEAVRPDTSPAPNEIMEVCTHYNDEQVCKNFTTDIKGYLRFVMPSQVTTRVEIKAVNYPRIERNWNDVMEESSYYKYSYNNDEYIDSANASLTIMEKAIECKTGEDVIASIPVVYVVKDKPSADVNIQISARGQVIATKKMSVEFTESNLPIKNEDKLLPLETVPEGFVMGSFEIPVTLTERSSPKISILVWYANEDGTVVADTNNVEVSPCLSHKVNFTWSTPKAEPGKEANLVINGANNALCSVGVVDKSVSLLSSENNKLDIQSILGVAFNSDVVRWDNNQLTLEYCYTKHNSSSSEASTSEPSSPETSDGFSFKSIHGRPYSRYSMLEAIHMFSNAGYFVLSNLILEKEFCEELIIRDMKNKAANKETAISLDAAVDRIMPSAPKTQQAFASFAGGAGFAGASPTTIPPLSGAVLEKSPSPANKEGAAELENERNYLPETWLWDLKPLSATGELNEPVTLPDTITEWVGDAVCVHPSEGVGLASSSIVTFTPFFVDLTLPSTATRGEILPIKISVFNYLDDDIPVKVTLEPSENFQFVDSETGVREICVPSSDKMVETVKVNMTQLGDVNLTIEATAQPLTTGACGTKPPPEKLDRLVRSIPVDPEGYLREKTWSEYVCSEDIESPEGAVTTWSIEAPESIVVGSDRAWITAIGDLMGPTLENIGNLVRLPSGCGEQNLVNFSPNIYILQYLDASNQTTPAIRSKITKFLNQGYQRQLLFRHSDGSFSSFGDKDKEGSTWLTAFVVKSFAQARNYTLIDGNSLEASTNWLKQLQNTTTGCYESRGRVINKMLQGGLGSGGGSQGLLTTYVLAAILEQGNINEENKTAALKCVETDTSDHPYSLALKSYTLALAKSPNAKTVIDQLIGTAQSNASMLRWNLPDRKGQNTALHVETAAYALLAMVTHDYNSYKEEARKIVRWISNQRNGQGGFISTQDTVVALQALAAFEKAQPRKTLNMDIKVTSTDLNHSFKVADDNKFLQQLVDVPKVPADVGVSITGQGCALVQGVLRYNVLSESATEVLTLEVAAKEATGKDCKTQNITACASYTLQDGASNMAIIEFKLVTGYIPIKQDLKDVVGDGKGIFKKYEVDGPKVIFYLEELTSQKTCASIRIYREVEVGNAKPGSVTVYDYYQPEYTVTQKYELIPCPSTP